MFISQNAHIGLCVNDAALPDATSNIDFNNRATYWLAQQQLTHAVDSLNSYINYTVIDLVKGSNPQVQKHQKVKELLSRFCKSDGKGGRPNLKDCEAREVLELLGINFSETTSLIIETRHCAIHHGGRDKDGKVLGMLTSQDLSPARPTIPLQVDSEGVLLLSRSTGEWAFEHVLFLIQDVDHILATQFGLMAYEYAIPPITRKFSPRKHDSSNTHFYSPNTTSDRHKIEAPLLDSTPSIPIVIESDLSGFKLTEQLVEWLTNYAIKYAEAFNIRAVARNRSLNFGAGLDFPEHYSKVTFGCDGKDIRSDLCIRGQVSQGRVSVYIQTGKIPLREFSHLECSIDAVNHLKNCVENSYTTILSGS